MSDTPKSKQVYIDAESHGRLAFLAEVNKRTLGGQVEHLIEEAMKEHRAEFSADEQTTSVPADSTD